MLKKLAILCFYFVIIIFTVCSVRKTVPEICMGSGQLAGEVTATSVILQSRLTVSDGLESGDIMGSPGMARFKVSISPEFKKPLRTEWVTADSAHDFIIKQKVTGLQPGTRYYYRLVYGASPRLTFNGPACTFRTLNPAAAESISLAVVTGMNYHFFYSGRRKGRPGYQGPDRPLGYPALATILNQKPGFLVATGDNVYYDHCHTGRAKTLDQMRRFWHQQFSQPRIKKLFELVPTYWEKDDHDHRYNDSDTTGTRKPSHRLGLETFWEQVPIVDPQEPTPVTYRTYQLNKLLQVWFTEGRDFRSPNQMPDGPEKTLWGVTQREWLKKTLLESQAVFKVLISPTPLVGPDDAYKKDNHTNHKGFRHEGDAFFGWLAAHGFLQKNFYIVCGDRHWQYHSIHPSGFEEFSCGALIDLNSRLGQKPGAPKSTDPDAKIKQPFTQSQASGGFLKVTVLPDVKGKPGLEFSFYDEKGVSLYSVTKSAL